MSVVMFERPFAIVISIAMELNIEKKNDACCKSSVQNLPQRL
jgi:hypothetical protein